MAVRLIPYEEVVAPPRPDLTSHDRVAAPDGRVGHVIGFYMREVETVLVAFEPGDVSEFPPADLQRIEPLDGPATDRRIAATVTP